MGRRAAAPRNRKGRRSSQSLEKEAHQEISPDLEIQQQQQEEEEEEEKENENSSGFFACYLLCSLSPRHKGRTYIGFTVNPRRRIRQHNGEIRSGAWRTKRGRPWEMILCIYGFPTNVSALQFEWAWQHPTESLAVRKAASNFKSLAGIANKIKIAYTMLNLPSWENLNLTVNFFSTKYMKHLGGCPRLPKQMKVNVCIMDDLPCYTECQTLDFNEEKINEDVSLSTISSSLANEIKEASFSYNSGHDGYDNFEQESRSLISPIPGEKYDRTTFNKFPNSYNRQNSSNSSTEQSPVGCSETSADDLLSPESTSKSPNTWGEEHSFKWLEAGGVKRQSSSLESSNNEVPVVSVLTSPVIGAKTQNSCSDGMQQTDNFLFSDECNVINLSTPSSRIFRNRKRAKVCSEIIDLTDSPLIIQL